MMRKVISTLLLAVSAMALVTGVCAQTNPPAKKPTSKPAAKSVAKTAPAKAAPAIAAAPVALTDEQLSIAQIVHTGRVACADGKSVTITADAKNAGAFDLSFASVKYDVVPVPTKSGAVRLEDAKTGLVFMQLANKSMLFNERQSRRLADDCISPAQQAVADAMRANPTASVLDGPAK
jgi:Na+-transporting methylmalonyl-CoA/oxaloacetate decarboxylase gamma subunit